MPQHTNTHPPADEIDLVELFQVLWKSKTLIIAITLTIFCMAAGYAFLSPPIYQTSVHILPPTASGLVGYNLASQVTSEAHRDTTIDTKTGIDPITVEGAYEIFLRHLNSSRVRQLFFETHYLPAQKANSTEADRQRAWERLDSELSIQLPARAGETQASIALEGKDSHTIAEWANAYAELAVQAATSDVLSRLAGEVEIRKRSLEGQIAAARQVAQHMRQNQIARLQSALAIAQDIGLESPTENTPLIAINTQESGANGFSSSNLLYLRGTKALNAELQQLQQRDNDDAYIAELPNLRRMLALLNSINLKPEQLSVATIDQSAIAPEEPVKPKKALILMLGVILGGMFGVFVALLRHMLRRR